MYYAARDYFESYRLRARCKLVRIPPSASLQIKSPASAAVSSNRNDALRAAECMPLMGVPGRVRCRSVPDISELQDLLSLCLCCTRLVIHLPDVGVVVVYQRAELIMRFTGNILCLPTRRIKVYIDN